MTLARRQQTIAGRLAEATSETAGAELVMRLRGHLTRNEADRQALVALIEEMVAADAMLAQTAPSVGALLRSAIAGEHVTATFVGSVRVDDLEDASTPDDVLRVARVRGQAEAAVLAEPMFDSAAVAQAMGSQATNAREFARQLRQQPGVLALALRNRFVFPAFQFDVARRRLWPVSREINQELGAADDPWGVAGFWFTIDPRLGTRPADLVGHEERTDDLRAAVARELAPIG
jgi:putative intracellular protease/amidase